MTSDPWTVYWRSDHLESCISSQSPADSEQIGQYWRELAAGLGDGAEVLDLACGNGALAKVLLSVNKNLKIHGVDRARIAPLAYLSKAEELKSVQFLAETDICDLPFDEASFDAVTSQFGLEYAPIEEACHSAVRMLKKNAQIRLLMHHRESAIVRPAEATIVEISKLLEGGGVIAAIESYVSGQMGLEQLESIGQHYLEHAELRSKQVSGQIFAGINRIVTEFDNDPAQAAALSANMRERLVADKLRLQQLQAAALDAERAERVRSVLGAAGIRIDVFEPFSIHDPQEGEILIGWQLSGIRN